MTTLTPKVKWAERPEVLYVTVEAAVKNPEITIESNKVKFEGKDNENKTYSCEINLFKDIDPKESKTDLTGRYPKILLKKAEAGPYWNFLSKGKKADRFIETDWALWKDEDEVDEEDDSNKFGDFGGMPGGMGGMDFSKMMSGMGGMGGMGDMMGDMGNNMDDLEDEEDEEEEKNNDQTEETKLNSVD